MNVTPKDVAAAGFNLAAWHEELLALNPWARGLTIGENDAEFAEARQRATWARHAEGKEGWNGWGNGMLALKAALEAAGEVPGIEATKVWLALAASVFSTEAFAHRFENDVSFGGYIFPSDAFFGSATFSGIAKFESATFSGEAGFER